MVAKDGGDGPIDLDVALVDFESFLKAFLPRASAMYDNRPKLTKEEWISVLKLSTKWLFNDLRQLAISYLSSPSSPWLDMDPIMDHLIDPLMDPIERICLAKEYKVYDWLLRGYEQVLARLLTSNNPDGSPTTLTTQEGKRIGMDVALELSGIAIRRMRLAEDKALFRSTMSDVMDAFKHEFDCVQGEEARFMTRLQRSEEAARKKEEEEVKRTEEEAKRKDMEAKATQRVLEEEGEKESALREAEREKGAGMELQCQGEGAEEAKQRQLGEEKIRLLEAENAKRLEEEEIEKLKKEIAKTMEEVQKLMQEERDRKWKEEDELRRQKEKRESEEWKRELKDEEDRKLRALAIEELRRRKGLADEKVKEESTSG
ncbi:hypothetical protein BKA70DRAFT_1320297 [Coprinopsis sp. MPI-PUGE-AT-0042]|nr:hypothetical protein BKA70DRAFT_1320297 [Coprinopsis sp. MPI-PUGE-AT-0042]